MPESDYVARNLRVRQVSVFDMGELYKVMFRWFATKRYDFQEKEYLEKRVGEAKQLEIKWIGYRKISDYIKFFMEVKFLVVNLKDVEVEIGGMRRKTNSGDVEMRFDAYLQMDYEGKWEGNPVTKFFREVYNKYMIKKRIESYEEELLEELYELTGEIKAFLNLYQFQKIEAV
jgi:hypothetical protein